MNYNRILLCIFIIGTYQSYVYTSCNLGSLTAVSGSPFSAGSPPYYMAYSPSVAGNVYAMIGVFSASNNLYLYSVNTSTGAFTPLSGSPLSLNNNPVGVSYSSVIYGNLFAAAAYNQNNSVAIYIVNNDTGAFTAVPGSPFAAGSFPWGVAFSPLVNGNVFVAVANQGSSTISIYSMNTATGVLTPLSGSPLTVGSNPRTVAFSPIVNGKLFAAISIGGGGTVSVFSVNTSTGVFTAVPGSPFSVGSTPTGCAFSPLVNGNLFAAIANTNSNTVSVFSVNTSTGVFTAVAGSPFAAGTNPGLFAFSPVIAGKLFAAVPNTGSNNVSVFSVNTSTGVFTAVSGSPFATGAGTGPFGVAFSQQLNGRLFLATSNQSNGTTSVFQVATLTPTITTSSQFILSGNSVTINGTISGGTTPYTITWQDGVVQSGINTASFSRIVSPTSSTIYYVSSISDANSCVGGPSNTITIAVRTCP